MNWIVLKSLNEIYHYGKTTKKQSLLTDPFVLHLLNNTKELKILKQDVIKRDGFEKLYRRKFLDDFNQFDMFLRNNKLLKPQTRFEENDIRILISINEQVENGELYEVRKQIILNEETVRGVSLMFFKDEKYLEGKSSLVDAVKQLLDIEELANDKDQQYLYVLECHKPKKIVLCENLDFLKRPAAPRANNIELWYAGGKNISKLDYIDTRGLPIFYSCDWDYDGLKIFELVIEKIPQIQLLNPNGSARSIKESDHKSLWLDGSLSGLNKDLYSEFQKEIINNLVINNEWIVEESNNLTIMLNNIANK